ncbi:hypothetical protein TWF281_009902 [Arthrobotrys megalospora]
MHMKGRKEKRDREIGEWQGREMEAESVGYARKSRRDETARADAMGNGNGNGNGNGKGLVGER